MTLNQHSSYSGIMTAVKKSPNRSVNKIHVKASFNPCSVIVDVNVSLTGISPPPIHINFEHSLHLVYISKCLKLNYQISHFLKIIYNIWLANFGLKCYFFIKLKGIVFENFLPPLLFRNFQGPPPLDQQN